MKVRKRNNRTRTTDIQIRLNKYKVKALKIITKAIEGGEYTHTQIMASKAALEMLRAYESPLAEAQNQ